jgi:hypothetical protein
MKELKGSTFKYSNSHGGVALEPSSRFVQLKIVVMKD